MNFIPFNVWCPRSVWGARHATIILTYKYGKNQGDFEIYSAPVNSLMQEVQTDLPLKLLRFSVDRQKEHLPLSGVMTMLPSSSLNSRGSPLLIPSLFLIDFGITIRPSSSMQRETPVAFIGILLSLCFTLEFYHILRKMSIQSKEKCILKNQKGQGYG